MNICINSGGWAQILDSTLYPTTTKHSWVMGWTARLHTDPNTSHTWWHLCLRREELSVICLSAAATHLPPLWLKFKEAWLDMVISRQFKKPSDGHWLPLILIKNLFGSGGNVHTFTSTSFINSFTKGTWGIWLWSENMVIFPLNGAVFWYYHRDIWSKYGPDVRLRL